MWGREGQKGKRWKQFFQIGLKQDSGYAISFLVWEHYKKEIICFMGFCLNTLRPQEQESVPCSWWLLEGQLSVAELGQPGAGGVGWGETHFDSQSQGDGL